MINVIETALPTLSLQDIFPDGRRDLQVNPPPFEPSSTVYIQECNFTVGCERSSRPCCVDNNYSPQILCVCVCFF